MQNYDLEDYIANSHHYRGWIINEFSKLEKEIELFIMDDLEILLICGFEFQTIILDRMTFESKRASLKKLLEEKSKKKGFKKTNKNSYPHKSLLDELVALNEIRNNFAHFPLKELFLNHDYLYNAICLIKYRDDYQTINYKDNEIELIIERIHKSIEHLRSLRS